MGGPESEANRSAAGRSKRPAGNTNVDSKGPGNFGAQRAMKGCCAWKPSGATDAGSCYSPTAAASIRQKTEMRPVVGSSAFSGIHAVEFGESTRLACGGRRLAD